MPFVIKNTVDNKYITASKSQKIDASKRIYAKVYHTKGSAKGAMTWHQGLQDHWWETNDYLIKEGYNYQPYEKPIYAIEEIPELE